MIDDGAVQALTEKKRSLLPAGILSIDGAFARGDVVAIHSAQGVVIARGLSNYNAADAERIRGRKSHEVRAELAEAAYDEVVHRDNLVLV